MKNIAVLHKFASNIKKQKKLFKPIDIIYKPTKHIEIEPLCFFSNDLSKAYSSSYSLGEKKGCSAHTKFTSVIIVINVFIELAKQERHRKNCSGIPGVVYNFNNHNLISYQDNFNAKGNVPYVYFDFETTAPTFNFADPEQKKNICCFICDDSCFSSKVKFRSHNNSKEICTFSGTTYNFKLFY